MTARRAQCFDFCLARRVLCRCCEVTGLQASEPLVAADALPISGLRASPEGAESVKETAARRLRADILLLLEGAGERRSVAFGRTQGGDAAAGSVDALRRYVHVSSPFVRAPLLPGS